MKYVIALLNRLFPQKPTYTAELRARIKALPEATC